MLERTMNALCLVKTTQLELEGKRSRSPTKLELSPPDSQQHLQDSQAFVEVLGMALGSTPDQAWLLLTKEECVRFVLQCALSDT
jgi:hypothetical protein